jgi:hypothetical protein
MRTPCPLVRDAVSAINRLIFVKFGIGVPYESCRASLSLVKICCVKAVLRLGLDDFCPYFPYFMTDMGEIRYRRSPHNAVDQL